MLVRRGLRAAASIFVASCLLTSAALIFAVRGARAHEAEDVVTMEPRKAKFLPETRVASTNAWPPVTCMLPGARTALCLELDGGVAEFEAFLQSCQWKVVADEELFTVHKGQVSSRAGV